MYKTDRSAPAQTELLGEARYLKSLEMKPESDSTTCHDVS